MNDFSWSEIITYYKSLSKLKDYYLTSSPYFLTLRNIAMNLFLVNATFLPLHSARESESENPRHIMSERSG